MCPSIFLKEVKQYYRFISTQYTFTCACIFEFKISRQRRLHNEELHSLYRSPNIVRVIKSSRLRWAEHVARMEEGRSAFKILTGKPTGKRPLGRHRRRWEDNIRMDLKEIGINPISCIDISFKIHSNIVLPSMPMPSQRSLSCRFTC